MAENTTATALPVIDMGRYLAGEKDMDAGNAIAESLREFGAVIVRDPRVTEEDNDRFVDMMEKYFSQDLEAKTRDARPHWHHQVGSTPAGVEIPRDHSKRIEGYPDMCRPLAPEGPDPKWRFFWRIGSRPTETKFPELNAEPVVPEAFPEWGQVMDKWGNLMLASVTTVAELLGLGLGFEADTFASRMHNGPHLLAPTGSDLSTHDKVGTVLAGFHYDLNFLTIHGKSRFPALNVFLRDGSSAERKKVPVKVPTGCLLVQAGKQLEWLTGGHIQAGFHEVVVMDSTVAKINEVREKNGSLWRVSSTLFGHIASDQVLEPLGRFGEDQLAKEAYPPTHAGTYVAQELATINLATST